MSLKNGFTGARTDPRASQCRARTKNPNRTVWGRMRYFGFRKQRKEFFKQLQGAGKRGKHGEAKNRHNNNPLFGEVREKIPCVKSKYYGVISRDRKKGLRKYLGRGYV